MHPKRKKLHAVKKAILLSGDRKKLKNESRATGDS
jgi:hypothetical protein